VSKAKKLKKELKELGKRHRGHKIVAEKRPKRTDQKQSMKIPDDLLEFSAQARARVRTLSDQIFKASSPMPGVVPAEYRYDNDRALKARSKSAAMALDSQVGFAGGWAAGYGGQYGYGAFAEGQMFMGYPYLSELAQRPEYRIIAETTATEMTRKWIKIEAATKPQVRNPLTGLPLEAPDKTVKVKQLEDEMKRLKVQDCCRRAAEQDCFFGRSHIYVDVMGSEDRETLKTSIGNGADEISKMKLTRGSIRRFQNVEAVWSYPNNYNANDPLDANWYKPSVWFAMGKEVDASRFLTFVGREVPDTLKPAYSFGGLSTSQIAKPYVDNWLRTRQSVSDLLHSFTVWQLATNMAANLEPGGTKELIKRIILFNNMRDNKGMMLTDKETEEFDNTSAPLSTLDSLQAQAQEQMCTVAHTPKVKLLGLDPAGLNASSEGEIRAYYDWIHAYQAKFYTENLDVMFRFCQINLWGEVDPDLSYSWVDLWSMDEKQQAEVRKTNAETGDILVNAGAIDAEEERKRVASEEGSPYHGLDPNKVIVPPVDTSENFLDDGDNSDGPPPLEAAA
jgi:phage-related protein (TIGR01555 family)